MGFNTNDAKRGGGRFNLTGIRYNIPTSCFEVPQRSKQVAPQLSELFIFIGPFTATYQP